MAAENLSRQPFNDHRLRVLTAAQTAFDAAAVFLQVHARRILAVLLVAFVVLSIASCLVIGSVGMGIVGASDKTPQPSTLSADDATATYGAEQFHLQLTAGANQP